MRGKKYIAIGCLALFSCGADSAEQEKLRESVFQAFENEAKTEMKREEADLDKKALWIALYDSYDCAQPIMDARQEIKDIKSRNAEDLELSDFLLSNMANYTQGKKKFTIQLDPLNLNAVNPADTAEIMKVHHLMEYAQTLSDNGSLQALFWQEAEQVWFEHLMSLCYTYSYNGFRKIQAIAYSPTDIWKKDEPAYVLPAYAQFDFNQNTPIKFLGKEFTTEVVFDAPQHPGLHEYNGTYAIQEKGELVWKPFIYRILVEE